MNGLSIVFWSEKGLLLDYQDNRLKSAVSVFIA